MAKKFTFRVDDDPRVAILLSPDLHFLFDRFMGSICHIVTPTHGTFTNLLNDEYRWQVFRNPVLSIQRNFTPSAWIAAEQKSKAQVPNSAGVQAALEWHFRHTVIKCWCSEEIKQKCFENAGSDEWFAFMNFYSDDAFTGPSDSGNSSD
jgi:hypothetical protein